MILEIDQWLGQSGLLVGGWEELQWLSCPCLGHCSLSPAIILAIEKAFNCAAINDGHVMLWPFALAFSSKFSPIICSRSPPVLRWQPRSLVARGEQGASGSRARGHHRQVPRRQASSTISPPEPHGHRSFPKQLQRGTSLCGENRAGSVPTSHGRPLATWQQLLVDPQSSVCSGALLFSVFFYQFLLRRFIDKLLMHIT